MAESDLRARDGALLENWYIACLSRELVAGRTLQRIIYDRPFALYRGENGQATCLPDRCLHRHALISEGKVVGNCLRCPYHGWTYGPDGKVQAIPSEGPGSTPPSYQLKALPLVEREGVIWVWLGSQGPPAPPPFSFPHFEDPAWQHYFMITDFENEVTHLAENFMDVPHTVFVHAGWFRSPALTQVPITVETARGSVLVTYHQPNDQIGFTKWLLNPRGDPMVHTDRFLLPNLTRVDYHFGTAERKGSSFVIISQCTPVSTLKSRVYTAIIFRQRSRWLSRLFKPFLRFYTRQVIEQDVEIMANQGRSFRFAGEPEFRSTGADVVHLAIERLREFAQQGEVAQVESFVQKTERTIWI